MRPDTLELLDAMLARGVMPVIPAQGSVGASGDLAPLAHMAAALIGDGRGPLDGGEPLPAPRRCAAAGLAPVTLGAKEGLALLNGTQFSTAMALAGAVRRRGAVPRAPLVAGALSTEPRKGSRRAVRPAHPRAAPASGPDRDRRSLRAPDGRQRRSAPRT